MNKEKAMKTVRYALIFLILATLVFIYAQSFKSPVESAEDSNKVGDIIAEIIPPDTKPGEFVQTNIRKLAHFTEFFVLGAEIAVYALLFTRGAWSWAIRFALGLILALFDETVQMFTKRAPEIRDVWIDFLGYASALLIASGVFFAVRLLVMEIIKRKNRKQNG